MTTHPILSRSALALAATMTLAAQTPLFNDGTAFGGSKVFSEGLSPLSNPARFDQSPAGWYLSVVDGDRRSQDNKTILQDTLSTDPVAASAALARLKDSPWALRTRAYGLTMVKEGTNFGYTREEFHSALAAVDLDPTHLGTADFLKANTSSLDGRRVIVDRVHFGGGTLASGTAAGFNLRLERWSMGTVAPLLNMQPDVQTLLPGQTFPFPYSADDYALGHSRTDRRTLMASFDAGFTTLLADGLRFGVMADQLNAKRLWDVDMKPQYRAALQLDMGPNTQLTLESDINSAMRMPFPVKQQASAASLRYQVSPAVIFLVGAERRKIGDSNTTRVGASLQLRTPTLLLSFGFQAGQDRPLKGLNLMVN